MAASLIGSCSFVHELSVDDDVARSVEGDGVSIAAMKQQPNPSDEWLDTFLLLKVDIQPAADAVAAALTANGWTIFEDNSETLVLAAGMDAPGPVAELVLLEMTDFHRYRSDSVSEEFSKVELSPGSTYFVAIITPLNGGG